MGKLVAENCNDTKVELISLLELYKTLKPRIEERLAEFEQLSTSRKQFAVLNELVFCTLTPQSNAEYCWAATERICGTKSAHESPQPPKYDYILEQLIGVRFKYTKAKRVEALLERAFCENSAFFEKLFSFADVFEMRLWIVDNFSGIGMKEASHFLRNIGLGNDIAILDRHILRSLAKHCVIDELPKTLSQKNYVEIENKMRAFSRSVAIPMDHLDLLFWFAQTGKIYK